MPADILRRPGVKTRAPLLSSREFRTTAFLPFNHPALCRAGIVLNVPVRCSIILARPTNWSSKSSGLVSLAAENLETCV